VKPIIAFQNALRLGNENENEKKKLEKITKVNSINQNNSKVRLG
jgi:hypothetical protein